MNGEPVRTATLVTAVMAVVMMLISFGVLNWSETQVSTFEVMLVAVLPLLVGGVQVVVGEVARARVTPLSDPRDDDGARLSRADNSMTLRQQENVMTGR